MPTRTTIYLLPGTMCDQRLWSCLSKKLENRFSLRHVAIEKCFSIQAIRSKLMEEIPEQAHLLGFSMGGYLSMEFARQFPERVRSLVLVCASDSELTQQELSLRNEYIQWLQNNDYPGMSKQRMQKFIHPKHYKDNRIIETILSMDRDLGKEILMVQLQQTSHRSPLAAQLTVDGLAVQIIGAEQDNFVQYEQLKGVADSIPNSRLTMIEESGHMLPLEQPNRLAEVLNSFYSSLETH